VHVDARATPYDAAIARLREAARPERPALPALEPYLDKVRHDATSVTDRDLEEFVTAGVSEDEVFEQTVAVAVAAGLERLEAGLRVLP
jgi:alkylhydroperoxidase family enzyme